MHASCKGFAILFLFFLSLVLSHVNLLVKVQFHLVVSFVFFGTRGIEYLVRIYGTTETYFHPYVHTNGMFCLYGWWFCSSYAEALQSTRTRPLLYFERLQKETSYCNKSKRHIWKLYLCNMQLYRCLSQFICRTKAVLLKKARYVYNWLPIVFFISKPQVMMINWAYNAFC